MSYLPELLAVIAVCSGAIAVSVLYYFNKLSAVNKFKSYQGIALKVFNEIEAYVPDDFGSGEGDAKVIRAIHKSDLFLKKLGEFYTRSEGGTLSSALKTEAKHWAQVWAEEKKAK